MKKLNPVKWLNKAIQEYERARKQLLAEAARLEQLIAKTEEQIKMMEEIKE
jgi:hypothetical protein